MYVWCRQEIIKSKTDNRSYGKQWSSYFSVPNKIPERFLSTWPTFSMLTCNLPASDVSPEKQSGLLNYFLVNKTDFCEKSEEETKDVICFLVQIKTSTNFTDIDLENRKSWVSAKTNPWNQRIPTCRGIQENASFLWRGLSVFRWPW